MCIPGSGSSSGGGAILLVVLVLQAAARRPPSTHPSMVGCCVPTPLSTTPTPAAFVRCHAVVAVLAPVFVQPGQRRGSSAGGWRRSSARCARSQRTLADSPAPHQLSSPPAASDAPLAPRDIIGRRRRQRPRSVSVDFFIVVVERRGEVRVMAVPVQRRRRGLGKGAQSFHWG